MQVQKTGIQTNFTGIVRINSYNKQRQLIKKVIATSTEQDSKIKALALRYGSFLMPNMDICLSQEKSLTFENELGEIIGHRFNDILTESESKSIFVGTDTSFVRESREIKDVYVDLIPFKLPEDFIKKALSENSLLN